MDRNDIASVLERLSAHYQKEVDPATAHAWYESLHTLPMNAAEMALETITRNKKFFPNATEFRQACTAEARDMIRRSHNGDCGQCDRKWIEGNGGVYPCPSCTPDVHHQWETKWAPDIRYRRGRTLDDDTRLDANPVEGVEKARYSLEHREF